MTETTPATGAMQVDSALVRELAELLDATALTEIEVQDGDRKIRVARTAAVVAAAPAQPAPTAAAPAAQSAPEAPASAGFTERSPMVGTVYLAAEPTSKPFVNVGDTVAEGQTLVIIEAMKVMNPIAATRAGRVTRVCVENGQPVEYDQSLVIIE